jgi:hypothetical protein
MNILIVINEIKRKNYYLDRRVNFWFDVQDNVISAIAEIGETKQKLFSNIDYINKIYPLRKNSTIKTIF